MKIKAILLSIIAALCLSMIGPQQGSKQTPISKSYPYPPVVCDGGALPQPACVLKYKKIRDAAIRKSVIRLANDIKSGLAWYAAEEAKINSGQSVKTLAEIQMNLIILVQLANDRHELSVDAANASYINLVLTYCC